MMEQGPQSKPQSQLQPYEPYQASGERADFTEHTITSERLLTGKLIKVQSDQVRLPDGTESYREYVLHPGAVIIAAFIDADTLIFEHQYRHPPRRHFIELPAGKIDEGEPHFATARRELLEETGYRAADWARAGLMHNAIAYSTERIEVWFARGLVQGTRQLDHGEFLDVLEAEAAVLDEWARRGEITDAKTLVGLLWLQNWRAGRWPLEWQCAPA